MGEEIKPPARVLGQNPSFRRFQSRRKAQTPEAPKADTPKVEPPTEEEKQKTESKEGVDKTIEGIGPKPEHKLDKEV